MLRAHVPHQGCAYVYVFAVMCDFIDDDDGVCGRPRLDRAMLAAEGYSCPAEIVGSSCEDVIIIAADGRPSPGSTTLEDVLDSLLGLPPQARPTSPAQPGRTHV